MTRHLHFDCFNGISGDMTLGAMVDLGLDLPELERQLAKLPIGPFRLTPEKVKRSGIVATHLHVEVEENHHKHSHLKNVIQKIREAKLNERATRRAEAAFEELARAEAHVHGSTPEKIHFHEVGANDAILDITGAMLGVEMLKIESFSASPVAVGNGTVECAHGVMPVPAPATAQILQGMPLQSTNIEGELTTPTGAAILKTLVVDRFGLPSGFRASSMGYGAGTRQYPRHPNCLRLISGEIADVESSLPLDREEVLSVETEIDDMSPEIIAPLMDGLLAAGAFDVQFVPIQMKKNRPGQRLRVLCDPARRDRLVELLFRETSTFGVRVTTTERFCLRRRMEMVETPIGSIPVKVGFWGELPLKVSPEFEACRALAESTGRPLQDVYDQARRAIAERYFGNPNAR